jgi:hypothetical protein
MGALGADVISKILDLCMQKMEDVRDKLFMRPSILQVFMSGIISDPVQMINILKEKNLLTGLFDEIEANFDKIFQHRYQCRVQHSLHEVSPIPIRLVSLHCQCCWAKLACCGINLNPIS